MTSLGARSISQPARRAAALEHAVFPCASSAIPTLATGLRLRKLDGLAGHQRRSACLPQSLVQLRHGFRKKSVDLADLRVELLLQVAVEFARCGRGRGVGRVEREEEAADALDQLRATLEAESAFGLREPV